MINATAASLLGFLDMCPATGWELVALIEQSIGNFWNVTRSQVYRELSSLADDGLVKAGDLGPRDRRPFEITDKGRTAFTDWINREPGPDLIRSPLLLTVFFREHVAPEKLERYLTAHRLRHQTQLEEYLRLEEQLENLPGGPLDALRFGIARERSVLQWLEELENRTTEAETSQTQRLRGPAPTPPLVKPGARTRSRRGKATAPRTRATRATGAAAKPGSREPL